jgi:hypothetical protein
MRVIGAGRSGEARSVHPWRVMPGLPPARRLNLSSAVGAPPSVPYYGSVGRMLELSTKCAPSAGFQVAAETRAFLASRGIDLSGEQQTKTKTALEYFSQNQDAAVSLPT